MRASRPLLVLLLLLLLLVVTAAEAQQEGSGAEGGDGDIEQWIILWLTVVGVVLILLSLLGMSAASEQADRSEEVYVRDHRRGAVDALLGSAAIERRDPNLSKAERKKKEKTRRHLLDAFSEGWNNSEDSKSKAEQQKEIDKFFEYDVNDNWLMVLLEGAEHPIGIGAGEKPFKMRTRCRSCVGWKTLWCRNVHGHADAHPHQEAIYNGIRKKLRNYIRDHLYIRGQLEPPYKNPGAEAVKRLVKSAVALFDFISDILACQRMFLEVELASMALTDNGELGLAVAAVTCLTVSTTVSAIGAYYFVFEAKERVPGETKKTKMNDMDMMGKYRLVYFLVFLPAMTNPELLHHMPWWNRKALTDFAGLPSVRCALFCAIAAVLEDIPQLMIQLVYTQRTTGIENYQELSWQLQLSIGMGAASLLFRVLLRCFIALVQKFQPPEPEPEPAPLTDLYLAFDAKKTWPAGYADTLTAAKLFRPANHPVLRKRGWEICWIHPGEEVLNARKPGAEPLARAGSAGAFVYRDVNGDTFSFAA